MEEYDLDLPKDPQPRSKEVFPPNMAYPVRWSNEGIDFAVKAATRPQYDSTTQRFISSDKFRLSDDSEGLLDEYLNFDIESRKFMNSELNDPSFNFGQTQNDLNFTKKMGTTSKGNPNADAYIDEIFDGYEGHNTDKADPGLIDEDYDLLGCDYPLYSNPQIENCRFQEDEIPPWENEDFEYDSIPRTLHEPIEYLESPEERFIAIESNFDPFSLCPEVIISSKLNEIGRLESRFDDININEPLNINRSVSSNGNVHYSGNFERESGNFEREQQIENLGENSINSKFGKLKLLNISFESNSPRLFDQQPKTSSYKVNQQVANGEFNWESEDTTRNAQLQHYPPTDQNYSNISIEPEEITSYREPKAVFSKATFRNLETMPYNVALEEQLAILEARSYDLKCKENSLKGELDFWNSHIGELNKKIFHMQIKHSELLPLLSENYNSTKKEDLEISAISPYQPIDLENVNEAQSFFFDPSILVQNTDNTTLAQHSLVRMRSNRKSLLSQHDSDSPENPKYVDQSSCANRTHLNELLLKSIDRNKKEIAGKGRESLDLLNGKAFKICENSFDTNYVDDKSPPHLANPASEIGFINYQTFAQKTSQFQTLGPANPPKSLLDGDKKLAPCRSYIEQQNSEYAEANRFNTPKALNPPLERNKPLDLPLVDIKKLKKSSEKIEELEFDSKPDNFVNQYMNNRTRQNFPGNSIEEKTPKPEVSTAPELVGDLIKKFEIRAKNYESNKNDKKKDPTLPLNARIGKVTRTSKDGSAKWHSHHTRKTEEERSCPQSELR
jgi:hypothetical protein